VQAWSVACTLDAWRALREAECARLSEPMNEALESITHAADC
jgi:hypothetical protein